MPRARTQNVKINFLIQPKVLKALKLLARQRGTTYSELARVACREYAVAGLRAEATKPQLEPAEPIADTAEG